MQRFALLLSFCGLAHAANFACTNTGTTGARTWTDATAWTSCNSTYPNNGGGNTYTFTVGTGYLLTIPSGVDVVFGQSAANNTANGTVNATGSLTLAAGTATDPTTLTLKGDLGIVGQTTCTVCDAIVMNPSTVVIIDSDGSGTSYKIGQTQNGNPRFFHADCTDATTMPTWGVGATYQLGYRVTYNGFNYISVINSNTGNTPDLVESTAWRPGNCLVISTGATNGAFSARGFGFGGGNVLFKYAALVNLGSSTVPSIETNPDSSNNASGGADIQYSSITASGQIAMNTGGITGASVNRLHRSIIKSPLKTDPLLQFGTLTTALTTGVRQFTENVIVGGHIGVLNTNCQGCTIDGNYIESSISNNSGIGWTNMTSGREGVEFIGNFVLKNPTSQSSVTFNAPLISYNYIVNGQNVANQNCITITGVTLATTESFNVCALLGADDSGDSFIANLSNSGLSHTITGNAQELNRDNLSTGNLVTLLGVAGGGTDVYTLKRNANYSTTYAILDIETNAHAPGSFVLQNNTSINGLDNGTVVMKIFDTTTAPCSTGNPNSNDICSTGNCNYNLGIALASTNTCTNSHNGYGIMLSAASGWGANDINVSSIAQGQFSGLTRTFATAASDFMGYSATVGAWATSTTYAVGDIVSDSQSIWQGKTVLYRAVAAHLSASATRPGNGTTWLTGCSGGPCWEYATAHYMRQMIAAGARITDGSIGVSNDYPAKALALWTINGRVSSRRDLQCMGNDGESPWPIPFCAKGKAIVSSIAGF